MDIFFEDLNEKTQKVLLEHYGIESPEEMNWDVIPIAEVYVG